ncbi:hypothetical protein IW150_003133 [Coemansia sp. RSA 2607]|nr:hypothetical protein IW150_003133 [Coemansia sp. RSA 2607]
MAHHALSSSKQYPGPVQQIQPTSFSLTHPRDIRQILGSPRTHKSPYYGILRFTSRDSLLSTTDAERAGKMRRVFNGYFSGAYLQQMEPLILKQGIERLMQQWDTAGETDKREVNYCESFNLATFSIISHLVFGQEIEEGGMQTVRWMAQATSYMSLRAVLQLLPAPLFALVKKLPGEQRHYVRMRAYVERAIERRQKLGERRADLLQALVDGMQPPLLLSPDDVVAEAFLLLIGGIDPTAYTLTWTLHLLLLYPEHLRRAQSEVRSQFPINTKNEGGVLSYAELRGHVPFLDACIHESLRLVPVPCVQIPRTCPMGMHLRASQSEVPAGSTLFANIWGSHHSETHWHEPWRYNPQRFLDDPRLKHAVFTFGHGTRLCMGKGLAMMNMTVILANILRTYDVSMPEDYTIRGPEIRDARGVPRLMPMTQVLTAKPRMPDRDCRLIVKRHKE